MGVHVQHKTKTFMMEGEVIKIGNFQACSSGWSSTADIGIEESTRVVAIYNEEYNITLRYGEMNQNSLNVSLGDYVQPGTFLGIATKCRMLHLELYKGKGRFEGEKHLYQLNLDDGWFVFDYLGYIDPLPDKSRVCYDSDELMQVLDDTGNELMNMGLFLDEVFYRTRQCDQSCFENGNICINNECVHLDINSATPKKISAFIVGFFLLFHSFFNN